MNYDISQSIMKFSGSYEFFDMSEFALPVLCFESLAVGIESYVGPIDF